MSKMWEVDPETKAKLLDIQKQNGNNLCVDCGAPSPQWASPKFGVFMCLSCSGIHRGLGVHISFVRSVTMDGFKVSELKRMQFGGNKPWQDFFNKHSDNELEGRTFDDSTIKDRYDSAVGEEWKDRLSAKVDGKDYVPGAKPTPAPAATRDTGSGAGSSRSQTPMGRLQQQQGTASPARAGSPMGQNQGPGGSKKAQNEAYFAKMGQENASRPDNLPPSQGGKFGGFGSEPMPSRASSDDWLGEMSKDPLAGISKGFGWLSMSAKTGYDGWVKPNMQKLAESDFTKQAQVTAMNLSQSVQAGTRNAADSFNRFVEGDGAGAYSRVGTGDGSGNGAAPEKQDFWDNFGEAPRGPSRDRQDFWDSFGDAPKGPSADKKDFWDSFSDAADVMAAPGAARHASSGSTSIGTSAMRKPAGSSSAAASGVQNRGKGSKDDEWGEW